MPIVNSSFRPVAWQWGGHLQTIIPSLFRRVTQPSDPVEIPLPDGDRLVADYYSVGKPAAETPVIIIAHGLEGHSQQPYVTGMARAAQANGWAVIGWNFRGCGRADNLTPKVYYAGCSEDLDAVVTWARVQGHQRIMLSGYSMGANVTLKWLGEQGGQAIERGVVAAAVASAPVDLEGCADTLGKPSNWLYRKRFVRDLSTRLRRKAERFPNHFDLTQLNQVRTVRDFDEFYTGPLQGYANAAEYYAACSAQRFMWDIMVPTLVVNAVNDPFLSPSCFPLEQAATHSQLYFEAPESGGHVGFQGKPGPWYLDERFSLFLVQALTDATT
ncbi:YheT family hydrolase [Salinispirillum marinum]|uniref:YheT family hydrolase n=2 Tax=Saccharospirillaceae TaxID=255527 RepID=A0ABV8BCM9_9GAMM